MNKGLHSCFRKNIYFSKEEAEKAVEKALKERKVKLRVYKCPFCKGFHLTSKV